MSNVKKIKKLLKKISTEEAKLKCSFKKAMKNVKKIKKRLKKISRKEAKKLEPFFEKATKKKGNNKSKESEIFFTSF